MLQSFAVGQGYLVMAGVMDELRLEFGSRDLLIEYVSAWAFCEWQRHNLGLPRVKTEMLPAVSKERHQNYVKPNGNYAANVGPRLSGQGM